jgi:hypothetical protein
MSYEDTNLSKLKIGEEATVIGRGVSLKITDDTLNETPQHMTTTNMGRIRQSNP